MHIAECESGHVPATFAQTQSAGDFGISLDETAKIIEKLYKLEPAIAKEAVDNMIGPKMWSEGEFSITELNRIVEGLKLIGEVKSDIDWSTVLDKSFLPADLQAKQ